MLSLADTRRYSRQIALPEVGPEGQARLRQARALIVASPDGGAGGEPAAAAVTADYLTAAGVGEVRVIDVPLDPAGWLAQLDGASVVLRFSFDDDPLLRSAVHLGVPVIFALPAGDRVDLFAFRRHGPCPHGDRAVPVRAASGPAQGGPAAVVASTLAASEALWLLVRPDDGPRARMLRLPLDGGEPVVQELPWTPECFLCGGSSPEVNFQ